MPKVTALMSVYNGEKYLREAVESILNQTFEDFEFIIINDGSSDSSRDKILSYKDSRIRFIENEKNLGLTKSLNRGLRIAKGKYIARIDVDDISMPGRFEKQVSFLDEHKEIALVGSWIQIINPQSGEVFVLKYDCDPVIIKWTLLFKNPIAHSSAFFRKEIIEEMGYYKEKYKYAQDFDLWFRISRRYKIANIAEVLVKYRIHDESVTKAQQTYNMQRQFVSEIIFNNINYYINLSKDDFEIFRDALRDGRILNFRNFIKVRKFYKDLFNSYIKKEDLIKNNIKKILPDYIKKRRSMFKWILKYKFYNIYNLCKKFIPRNICF